MHSRAASMTFASTEEDVAEDIALETVTTEGWN
jgi:hypothetical protein